VGGALRLRYREGFDKQKLLKPGKRYTVQVPLSYIGHTFKEGHRIRVNLLGTEFPLLDPNPNTGEPIATAVRTQKSKVTVYHDKKYPSFVSLPVVRK